MLELIARYIEFTYGVKTIRIRPEECCITKVGQSECIRVICSKWQIEVRIYPKVIFFSVLPTTYDAVSKEFSADWRRLDAQCLEMRTVKLPPIEDPIFFPTLTGLIDTCIPLN